MIIAVVFNQDGSAFSGVIRTDYTLTKLKIIKEVNNRTCLIITNQQAVEIDQGWTVTGIGGVVTVTEPVSWLAQYKKTQLMELKKGGKKTIEAKHSPEDQRNGALGVISNVQIKADISAIMADYATTKTAVNMASDKTVVDMAINNHKWTSI